MRENRALVKKNNCFLKPTFYLGLQSWLCSTCLSYNIFSYSTISKLNIVIVLAIAMDERQGVHCPATAREDSSTPLSLPRVATAAAECEITGHGIPGTPSCSSTCWTSRVTPPCGSPGTRSSSAQPGSSYRPARAGGYARDSAGG
jgi:hypothetical protein